LIEKVTRNPRLLLNLPVPKIEINEVANLTLFDPAKTWRLDEKTNLSKSKNSPWFGKDLKGKAIAVFNNGQYSIEQQA
jgi:dihydroorotase